MKAAYSLFAASFYATTLMTSSSIVNADPISIRGFASAGFVTGDTQFDYISASDSISESSTFGADNTIGLQVNAQINDKTEFTSQLLAKGTVDAYNLDAHWGYISYSASPSLTLRAGRLVLPIAAMSEYVDVGYAIPWVRPPTEIYSAALVNNYSGFNLLYTLSFKGMQLVLQPLIGSLPKASLMGVDASAKQGLGLNTTLNFDQGSLSASHINVSDLELTYFGEDLSLDLTRSSISANLEFGNLLLITEYVQRSTSRNSGSSKRTMTAWYTTVGYQLGKFTPHLSYAKGETDTPQTVLAAGTPFTTPTGTVSLPEAMIFEPAPFSYRQESMTLGLRYDAFNKVAFKLEAQEIKPIDNSWGLFAKDPGDKAHLFSFVVDVTF